MRKELEKNYQPSSVEKRHYANWLEKGYFHAEPDPGKEPYCIVIPPPNITNRLHVGHALNNTLQDILIRAKRMQGYSALWLPGTDHASIATEARIVDTLQGEGLTKQQIGRDEFLKRAWDWNDEFGSIIISQLKQLGCSCDWDRTRFTLDEGLSDAVLEAFIRYYEKGLIYRGEKLINWCPHCKTSISDAEVNHEEKDGTFWHFRYKFTDSDEYIYFVTSRPETILGDAAIAVNPKDERYTHLVGRKVLVPIVNREIPVIADDYVDMKFGTGVVKITPAHDPNDYEVGERHGLQKINVFTDEGNINEIGGKYEGMNRFEARKCIVEEFKNLGLFVKSEAIKHSVGIHERCGTVVEPSIKTQWFVRMKELAQPALEMYQSGEVKFYPERAGKIYQNWLVNIKDWCISRQLWWGHRIPVYYCEECGKVTASKTAVDKCPECGGKCYQDPDTLDTWFSSALWPFSTLGWPENTKELEYYYPTNVLVTAIDIIFFWVARMVFSGMEFMGKKPFRDVYINGIVRDELGRKMSKSLGNGVDPLDIIATHGADALRMTLFIGTSIGNDMRFSETKLEASRNFLNKLWNAARFILMNLGEDETKEPDPSLLASSDKWILSRSNELCREIKRLIDGYDFGLAIGKLHDFIWDEFCDWYIEMVKPRLYNQDDATRNAALWTLGHVLGKSLKLLHPFMPFITEELYTSLTGEETVMLGSWPEYDEKLSFTQDEKAVELIKSAIKGIRSLRRDMDVPPSRKARLIISSADPAILDMFRREKSYLYTLGYSSEIEIGGPELEPKSEGMVTVIIDGAKLFIPFAELVDIKKELERLGREREKLIKEVERVNQKLANPGFVAKAPEKLLTEEREKKAKYESMLTEAEKQIEKMRGM